MLKRMAIAWCVAAFCIGGAHTARSQDAAKAPTAAPTGEPALFDHHVHVLSPQLMVDWKKAGVEFSREDEDYTDSLKIVRENELAGAFLISMAHLYTSGDLGDAEVTGGTEQENVAAENDFVSEAASRSPGKLWGFFSVNPLREYSLMEAERCQQLEGMLGMKLHLPACGVDLMDDTHLVALKRMFGWAERNDVPILIHLFPATVDGAPEVLARRFWREGVAAFPKLRICLAHLGAAGGFNEVSAAVLQEYEAFQGACPEERMPEVFFDWSGAVLGSDRDGLPTTPPGRRADLCRQMERIGLQHFLFASDYPVFSIDESIATLKSLPWRDRQWESVLRNRSGWGPTSPK